jgi:integrase
VKQFFFWLADQPGYKARLQYSAADYFKLSEKEMRIATAQREGKSPTLEQMRRVIETMLSSNEIECRDRALVAFTLLTGARVSAIASMKLKHVGLKEGCVHQDAQEVKTKFSKTFTTYSFPVGDGIEEIVADWVRFLHEEKLWGNDDPLFPATRIVVGKTRQFETAGLDRTHWSSTGPIRKVFRGAFERAGLPYFHPHSLRKTLTRLAQKFCNSAEEYKAWSQNLGHEKVLTTFLNYGSVATERQGEIIRGLGAPKQGAQPGTEDIAEALFRKLRSAGASLPAGQ